MAQPAIQDICLAPQSGFQRGPGHPAHNQNSLLFNKQERRGDRDSESISRPGIDLFQRRIFFAHRLCHCGTRRPRNLRDDEMFSIARGDAVDVRIAARAIGQKTGNRSQIHLGLSKHDNSLLTVRGVPRSHWSVVPKNRTHHAHLTLNISPRLQPINQALHYTTLTLSVYYTFVRELACRNRVDFRRTAEFLTGDVHVII